MPKYYKVLKCKIRAVKFKKQETDMIIKEEALTKQRIWLISSRIILTANGRAIKVTQR